MKNYKIDQIFLCQKCHGRYTYGEACRRHDSAVTAFSFCGEECRVAYFARYGRWPLVGAEIPLEPEKHKPSVADQKGSRE